MYFKYPAWVIGEAVLWTLQDTYYIRPYYQDRKSCQLYLIHRNKHRETAKMSRQRDMAQMKEQNTSSEKELNKMEISNLSDTEFRTLVIRMLKEISGYFDSRVDKAKNQINDLEHKEEKDIQSVQKKEKESKKSRIV